MKQLTAVSMGNWQKAIGTAILNLNTLTLTISFFAFSIPIPDKKERSS
jgi:hypothetical protein